jgi:hypothetical protein
MEAVLPALVAVVGTLLGSVITYRFQQNSFERAEKRSNKKQFRSERISLYSDFAGAIFEFRRAQSDWWISRRHHPEDPRTHEARLEAYRFRGVAHHELFRVQLITANEELVSRAKNVYDLTTLIIRSDATAEQNTRSREALDALESFIALASKDVVQQLEPVPRTRVRWSLHRPRPTLPPSSS